MCGTQACKGTVWPFRTEKRLPARGKWNAVWGIVLDLWSLGKVHRERWSDIEQCELIQRVGWFFDLFRNAP